MKAVSWRHLKQRTGMLLCFPAGGFESELHLDNAALAFLGPDVTPLKLSVVHETASRLHIKITDSEGVRWQVPDSLLPR